MVNQFGKSLSNAINRANAFLDRYVLPWPVKFLTFRFIILITVALLIPLILFTGNAVLVLGINSYLNTMSVAVSSIVLLNQMVYHNDLTTAVRKRYQPGRQVAR